MPLTNAEIRRETDRRLRRLRDHVGQELRRIRGDANVSVADLSRATGIDDGHICRIEAGLANASHEVLIALGVALGADLSLRYFAGSGPRIHDRFQAPITEALLRGLNGRWSARLEVPVSAPTHGVIDVVLSDAAADVHVAVEVQTELRRLEQQIRWAREKAEALAALHARDGSGGPAPVCQLLVLRSTVRTREIARAYEATLRAAYPARACDGYDSLMGSAQWPGSVIVWAQLNGAKAALMRHPPPGVRVGR